MPKLDLDTIEPTNRTGYPEPFASDVAGRWYRRIGDAAEFKDFGASHVVLTPGATSAQRHWHEDEDELAIMLAGEDVLVEEDGRETMQQGDNATFPMRTANGHQLFNESEDVCAYVAIGWEGRGGGHSTSQ